MIRFKSTSKNNNNKKNKEKKPLANNETLDDLLDELESDDDESDENSSRKNKSEEEVENEVIAGQSPVAKFILEAQKGNHLKRKADAKGKHDHHQTVSYFEIVQLKIDIDSYWNSLQDQVEEMKQHYIHHITLRSSTSLDDLPIELEGDQYPLHEIASISKKDPKRLIIDCHSFPQATSNIVKAITNAGMNLNPQQEGTRIFVPIPKVTKEYRERLVKGAKQKFVELKEELRKTQTKFVADLGNLELQHETGSKDQFSAVRDVAHTMVEHFSHEAEQIMLKKQRELLGK